MEIIAPAPTPQMARPVMNSAMLWAPAHQAVPMAKTSNADMYTGLRPNMSDIRPKMGCSAADVSINAVDSQDAEFDALKYEVTMGWLDTIKKLSNIATKY